MRNYSLTVKNVTDSTMHQEKGRLIHAGGEQSHPARGKTTVSSWRQLLLSYSHVTQASDVIG